MHQRLTSSQRAQVPSDNLRLPGWGVIAFTLLLALYPRPATAQVLFGSVVGNVTDASGAAVPGASVRITEGQTNETRAAETNEAGNFTVSTVPAGTYQVEITKTGFRGFVTSNILVNQNNVVRIDAALQVGAQAEKIEVSAESAALQTDRADVHAEVSTQLLENLPQPNRSYEGLLVLVPGTTPPGGQLNGGTNNPSKSMQFSFNGTGNNAATVRIEGVSAMNPWVVNYTTFVPSVEAIENVNVTTSAADAEQGLSGGASVNVSLKSGSNRTHGAAFGSNIDSYFEANNFFANAAGIAKPPHLVNNNAGGSLGGHIIKDKLFYFGSYEGDYAHQADSGIISIPAALQLSGNLTGSANPIYDPNTGAANGTGRTPFPGQIIPQSRISPIVQKLIPNFPATNLPGVVNNYYVNRPTVYNLHKIDTKVDYTATQKLRLSGRWGYQPFYNLQQPLYGQFLGGSGGFASSGAGNYLQNGATLAISGSGTYVLNPTFVIDATFGITQAHQLLFPTSTNERLGSDALGIPGTNIGKLPWAGGLPNFVLSNFVTFGYSYPALEYKDPIFEEAVNATKTKGAHTVRFGLDLSRQHQNHIEVNPTAFTFSGNITALNGGPGANVYNQLGDFLLGLPTSMGNSIQAIQPTESLRTWEYALYVRDQFQVNRKLTINYGTRWEKYPVPTQETKGISIYDFPTNTLTECGVGGVPKDCGIHVSSKLFAPSIGVAYRPLERTVIRAGYSLAPSQDNMARDAVKSYPDVIGATINGATSFTPAGSLTTGVPVIPVPTLNNGSTLVPAGTGNVSGFNNKNYVRGYIQSYNFTVQHELKGGFIVQAGYVGSHSVHMLFNTNVNFGTIGGGAASQPLFSQGITAAVNIHEPWLSDHYNSLQVTAKRRYANGLTIQSAYTYSKDINTTPSVEFPGYTFYDHYATALDRTHNLNVSTSYELPFGKNKAFARNSVGSAVLGGWAINSLFGHVSGSPFTVSASSASCNCPGLGTQTADQIKQSVAVVGTGVGGQAYFDPLAYAPVTGARLGTSGFNQLRGPGNTNMDANLFRTFRITERFSARISADALNVSNTKHFANPGANVSNLQLNPDGSVKNLNGFSQITATNQLGRLLDQRYFRFGVRILF
jgi:hypothetical protein